MMPHCIWKNGAETASRKNDFWNPEVSVTDNKYSVLMSVYINENPQFLRNAIDSILKQTISPDEIVLVEDGPLTDELYLVIDSYISLCPELFNIVKNEKNLGLGLSLKRGLLACKNELVARMDTDDIAVPDRCQQQLSYFCSHPEISIIGGNIAEFIGKTDNIIGYREVPCIDCEIKKYFIKRCPFNHMTVMFKKSSVLAAGNYIDWHYNEDYYLWLRMMQNGAVFANTGTVLVNVRVGEEMYRRRGGTKYFRSEAKLQRYMLKNRIISFPRYVLNVSGRFVLQVLMPNRVRGWIFKKFARKQIKT